MDLSSYLLKPVQRMGKYALMIKQIIKECPNSAQEHHDLKAAEEMVRFQLRHGNDLLAMDALKECDVSVNIFIFIILYPYVDLFISQGGTLGA